MARDSFALARNPPYNTDMYGLPLILAMGLAWSGAQNPTALHPDIDAFRSGDKAYVIAPPRPVAAFDYIEMVHAPPGGSEWLLVEHRQRRAQDAMSHIKEEDFLQPVETSLFHPGRNIVRPLPTALPPGRRYIGGGQGDVVTLTIAPQVSSNREDLRIYAVHAPTGRYMELEGENQVWVVDDGRFLTEKEGRLWLLDWNGERQSIPWDRTANWVMPTGEVGKFALGTRTPERSLDWYLLDVNTREIQALNQEGLENAYALQRAAPSVMNVPEPGRPDTFSAWFGNEEATDLFEFDDPSAIWGTPDGRLPHELDSRGFIAGDISTLQFGVPAGYSRGFGSKLGAAWYVRDRMMFVRAVEEMSVADYAKYIASYVRRQAMNLAKQAGVAINIFSADNDDRLPENAGWREATGPYLKNNSILGRVTYLGNGERLTEVQDLQSVMGFIDTPYGRANISYDSSVRWVPKVTP